MQSKAADTIVIYIIVRRLQIIYFLHNQDKKVISIISVFILLTLIFAAQ
jgi:hypothetical protein